MKKAQLIIALFMMIPVLNFANDPLSVSISPTGNNGTVIIAQYGSQLFTSTVAGGNGNYTYKWEWNEGWGFNPYNNQTGTSCNFTNVWTKTFVRLTVTSATETVASNIVTVDFTGSQQPLSIGNPSMWFEQCNYGGSTSALSYSVNGGDGNYTYQWQQSLLNQGNFTDITGATAQTYTGTNVTQQTYYRLIVSSGGVTVTATNYIQVLPYQQLIATINGGSAIVNTGTAPAQMNCSAQGGNNNYAYQWQSAADGNTWNNISNATNAALLAPAITNKTYYRCALTSNGFTVNSNLLITTVSSPLIAGSINGGSLHIGYKTSAGNISASAATGGDGNYLYQWEASTDKQNFNPLQNENTLTYTTGVLDKDMYYRLRIQSNGETVYTNVLAVLVYPQVIPGSVNPPMVFSNYNSGPGTLTIDAATGGDGTYVYQWQGGADQNNCTDIPGATGMSYVPVNMQSDTYFKVKITSAGNTEFSQAALVKVYPVLSVIISSLPSPIAVNTSPGQMNCIVQGGSGMYSYQWQYSTNNNNWSNYNGAINLNFTVPSLTVNSYIRCVVTASNNETMISNVDHVQVTGGGNNNGGGNNSAENKPDATIQSSAGTATEIPLPALTGMDETKMNYVKKRTFFKPFITEADAIAATDNSEVALVTNYTDGAARTVQAIARKAAPSGNDMISTNYYDNFGRAAQKYLPYTDGGSTGIFRTDAEIKQPAFYNQQFSGTEKYFYSNTIFESSPLNRVLKTTAPGNSWTGTNTGTSYSYEFNEANEVQLWTIDATAGATPKTTAWYKAGELDRTIVTDEHGKQVISYTDILGHEVLKKVQLQTGAPVTDHAGWLCTYYVYDDMDRLRFTITPKAIEEIIKANWSLSQPVIDGLCFYYEYDQRGRVHIKKSPGAAPVHVLYDDRDRAVMMQDGNLRKQNKWLVTKYDAFNRGIATQLRTDASDLTTLESQVEQQPSFPADNGTEEILTETYYDNYSWLNNSGSGFTNTMDATQTQGMLQQSDADFPFARTVVQSNNIRGSVTGSRVKLLGSNQYLYSILFYDEAGRMIQKQNTTINGGKNTSTTQYSFSGQVLYNKEQQDQPNATPQQVYVNTYYEYDHSGNLIQLKKYTGTNADNSDPSTYKIISKLDYDELGQLSNKVLSPSFGGGQGGGLETLTYTYNIRGWLNGINRAFANPLFAEANTQAGRYFGMELNYDFGFANKQYNGNISGAKWRTAGDHEQRAYGYDYDAANRFMQADFNQYTANAWNKTAGIDFDMMMGDGKDPLTAYDANGNILRLLQKGLKLNASMPVDELNYNYEAAGNKLLAVTDNVNATTTKGLGDFADKNTTGDDYSYDDNGNLIKDLNKDIDDNNNAGIEYNYLNLPAKITKKDKGTIEYLYDALGTKWQKKVVDTKANKTTITDYVSGAIYQDGKLQFISTEEGRVRFSPPSGGVGGGDWAYDYFIKDHLGNVRMILTEEQQKNNYPAVTYEDDKTQNEQLYYENADKAIVPEPGSNPANKVQSLRKNTISVGAGKLLKVMAEDKLNVKVDYLIPTQTTDNGTADGKESLINGLLNIVGNGTVQGITKGSEAIITTPLGKENDLLQFLQPQGLNDVSSLPKAYLNILFFDEQFRFVKQNSELVQVEEENGWKNLVKLNKEVPKNGYVYVYISNESNNIVYFDNLQVMHERGPILEENHFYPYGLKMAGISSKAAGAMQNSKQYQGEFSDYDDETAWNDFDLRNYDAQIGRFIQQDPYDQFASGYVGMGNDPINGIDPSGGVFGPYSNWNFGNHLAWGLGGAIAGAVYSGLKNGWTDTKSMGNSALNGALVGFGLSYVPWDKTGGFLEDAVNWSFKSLTELFRTSSDLHLSNLGYQFLKEWEKFKEKIYDAGDGKNTIGYGYVIPFNELEQYKKNGITEPDADKLMHEIMPRYEKQVKKEIKIKLKQNEFDAITAFTYNMSGGLKPQKKIINAINRKEPISVLEKTWYLYSNPNNPKIHSGLLNRRKDEFEIWKNSDYKRNY